MGIPKYIKSEILSAFSFVPDKPYLYLMYFLKTRKILNLRSPRRFNEKLQWMKLYDRKKLYTRVVDKYTVREYVSNAIGDEYLIPLLGVWDNANEIDQRKLPDKFVLKCNHDTASVSICKNKDKYDIAKAKEKLNRALRRNFFYNGREWPYKNVVPKVIAESYLEDKEHSDLRDYKFFCFNGEVKFFKIDFGRLTEHHANYYDPNGNILPFGEKFFPPVPEADIQIPQNLHDVEELAMVLSKEFPFCRVDFYDVNGKIYFGEITLFPTSGFEVYIPDEWDYKIGEYLTLPKRNN